MKGGSVWQLVSESPAYIEWRFRLSADLGDLGLLLPAVVVMNVATLTRAWRVGSESTGRLANRADLPSGDSSNV